MMLMLAVLTVMCGGLAAVPTDTLRMHQGAVNASLEPAAPPGRIMVKVLQVEEALPQPPQPAQPVRQAAGQPPPLPGSISFPSERLQQADDRQDSSQVWSWDSLSEGCGSTKNCLGIPADCQRTRTCRGLVTVQVIDNTFTFRMRASDAKWIAVGLGETEKMFDTSVIECVDDPLGTVTAYMSYTPSAQRGCIRISNAISQSAFELTNFRSMDGGVFCEVTRVNQTVIQGMKFYLDESPFFLQVASGTSLKDDGSGVSYHGHDTREAAARSTRMDHYTELGAVSNWPMRMHGSLMVLAWMFAATSGSLAARYFKATWGKATICNKAMWFAWHRLFMMLTLALHLTAVIAALIFLQGWSTSSGVHGILGGVTTLHALLQGVIGFLRPGPDAKRRPLFNWVHRGQGYVTHILAIVTIFLAVGLPSSGLDNYVYFILAAYVAFYVALHAVHSLTEVKSYYFLIIVFGSAVFAITMLVLIVIGQSS